MACEISVWRDHNIKMKLKNRSCHGVDTTDSENKKAVFKVVINIQVHKILYIFSSLWLLAFIALSYTSG
jgi:hypothetical protein